MKTGDKTEFMYKVQAQDLAKELSFDSEDDFPAVLATSRMIALMELAAARLMKPEVADNELSVGVNVNVNHLAATPVQETVRVAATFQGKEGYLYKFEVELFDSGGRVGSGTHTRAIVETERLIQGAINRVSTTDR